MTGCTPTQIAASLGTAAGSILGQELAGKLIDPSSVGQQLLGSLGANLGSDLGAAEGVGLASSLSTTIATTLGTDTLATLATDALLDLVLPGVGAIIGAVLGDVAGSEIYTFLNDISFGLFGDLFGSPSVWEYQYFTLDPATNELEDPASLTYAKNTQSDMRNDVAGLSDAVCNTVNSVISTVGGQAALTGGSTFDDIAWVGTNKPMGCQRLPGRDRGE